jgi:hypothetical protein
MSDFNVFAELVRKQFAKMSKGELFVAGSDSAWDTYLASFPEGTNPIFRVRAEFDCSCCRNFVRNVGSLVSIVDGQLVTVWDVEGAEYPFSQVAATMAVHVKAQAITALFRTSEQKYGAQFTKEVREGRVHTWTHFHSPIAPAHRSNTVGEARGSYGTNTLVFKRGLEELKPDAIATVLDLIKSNALYRGAEFLPGLQGFAALQAQYRKLKTDQEKNIFIWGNTSKFGSIFRNTMLGSLVVALSGTPANKDAEAKAPEDLESAVKAYEKQAAPENYKRSVALITPRMVEDAMKTLEKLGLEPATHRRFAKISDVSVNDILFVDNAVRGKMAKGSSIKGLLMDVAEKQTKIPEPTSTVNITIEDFIKNVVPKAKSMALFIKNAHQANFMSLTAPEYDDVPQIFKWNNGFAWSYDNNVTDSIRERVKAAGGKTNAAFRVSLAWQNSDDLDLHVHEPDRNHIYFGSRGRRSKNTGELDVDMNRSPSGYEFSNTAPVENVTWITPMNGDYRVVVNNFNKRSTNNQGYTVEVECDGAVNQYTSAKSPGSGQDKEVLVITLKGGKVVAIKTGDNITGGAFSQEKWGVATEQFVKVDTMMLSPNYWGDQGVGNKHYIFILEGCKNPLPTRGLYNEFLVADLEKHRKVFEVLGNKTMCEPTDDQLSGVGFSSTRNDTVIVKVVADKAHVTYNITF